MLQAIKNLWRYLKRYKGLFVLSFVTIIVGQALLLVAPLLVKELLDEHITGISYSFVEVKQPSEQAVAFDGRYYKQLRNFDPKDEMGKDRLFIIPENDGFFVSHTEISSGTRKYNETRDILTVTNDGVQTTYPLRKLTVNEVKAFYTPSIKPMTILVGLIFLRALLSIVAGYVQRITTAMITIYITRDARKDAVAGLHRLSIAELQAEPAGKTSARVIHDVTGLMTMFAVVINIFFNATIGFIFTYIGMFYLNPVLATATFIIFPIIYFWLRYFAKNIYKIAGRTAEVNSLLISQMNENINGITILQAFNHAEQSRDNFNKLSQEFVDMQMKEVKFHLGIGWNLIRFFKMSLQSVVILYFSWVILGPIRGVILAGTIYAYIDYLNRMLDPLDLLFMEFGNLQHAIVKTNRVFKLIDADSEKIHKEYTPRFKGAIMFDNVSFSYSNDPKVPYVLKDINLAIEPGQMIGLVGHTGSGKSSMMNLLMRFYDLKEHDKGKIFVDGVNITRFSKQTYRQHVGIILQEATLFSGTLADNIRFGKEGVLDREVEEIFRSVGGGRILDKLPDGIATHIDRSGSNLSVGEKQIVAFARALVYDPAILIMDEATANMDTETERMIQEALEVVAKDRTTIVIAHRLSTIREADKIVVLRAGEKIEEGNHSSLIADNGVYANMYRQQS